MCCGLVFRCTFYAIAIGTLVVGGVVLAIGAIMTAHIEDFSKDIYDLVGEENLDYDMFLAAVYMMIPVGTLLIISFFFGCCGALRSGSCVQCCGLCDGSLCLLVFIFSALITAVLVITSGVLSTVYKNSLDSTGIENVFQNQTIYLYNTTSNRELTESWDKMQVELECCGGLSYEDYKYSKFANMTSYNVPPTCCVEYNKRDDSITAADYQRCNDEAGSPPVDTNIVHGNGCAEQFEDQVAFESDVVSGVCYAFGLVNVAGIIVACCIRNRLEED